MKIYVVFEEYSDGWKDLQGVFSSKKKAEEFNETKNEGYGDIYTFELDGIEGIKEYS